MCDDEVDDAVIHLDDCVIVVRVGVVVDGFDAPNVNDDVIQIVYCDADVDDAVVDCDVDHFV